MPNTAPRWPRETTQRLNQLAEHFKANLRAVAESFARHENAEALLVRHVDEAHASLARLGLTAKRWYSRTEFFAGFGGLLIGGALAVPDMLGTLLDPSAMRTGLTVGVMVTMIGIGLFLYMFGWVRGTLLRLTR